MKFKIPENFNDLSLRDIFQQLKVPKRFTPFKYV